MEKELFKVVKNNYEVIYQPATGKISIKDLQKKGEWETQDICINVSISNQKIEIKPEDIKVSKDNEGLKLSLSCKFLEQEPILINLTIIPDVDRIRFLINPLENLIPEQLINVDFPYRFGMVKAGMKGYLVLPLGTGAICDFSPERKGSLPSLLFYSQPLHGYTLPFWGVVKDMNALAAIIKDPFDCWVRTSINEGNPGVYGIWPCWEFERERINYPREVDYFLLENADYIKIAKLYRQELISTQKFISFTEKSKNNPYAQKLPGMLNFQMLTQWSPKEGAELGVITSMKGMFLLAKKLCLDRMVVYNAINWYGYTDGFYDPFWPGIMSKEDEEEIKKAVDFGRSLSKGYVASVYHNFFDMSHQTPFFKGIDLLQNRDGSFKINCPFSSKASNAYTVCAYERYRRAKEIFSHLANILGKGNIYIDVEGAQDLEECFSVQHPYTRKIDAELRNNILSEVRKSIGTVNTEAGPDYLVGVIDMCLAGVFTNYMRKVNPPMVPVPLYPLVYNDAVRLAMNLQGASYAEHALYNGLPELWGWCSSYDTYDLLYRISYLLRDEAYEEIVGHQFLTEPKIEEGKPKSVQMVEYANGTIVVANCTSLPYTFRNKIIKPDNAWIGKKDVDFSIEIMGKDKILPGETLIGEIIFKNLSSKSIKLEGIDIYIPFDKVKIKLQEENFLGKTLEPNEEIKSKCSIIAPSTNMEEENFVVVMGIKYLLEGKKM